MNGKDFNSSKNSNSKEEFDNIGIGTLTFLNLTLDYDNYTVRCEATLSYGATLVSKDIELQVQG